MKANQLPLPCTGIDGIERTFRFEWDERAAGPPLTFRVVAEPRPKSGEFFEMRFEPTDDGCLKVVMMAHHGEDAYRAKGIPEALLLEVKRRWQVEIRSSRTSGGPGEFRTDSATKVWRRLLATGRATCDEEADVFHLS